MSSSNESSLDWTSISTTPSCSHLSGYASPDFNRITITDQPRSLSCLLPACNKSFQDCDSWKRHQSTHFKRWICMLHDITAVGNACAICGKEDTSMSHRASHVRLERCLAKPLHQRAFRGPDKLRDHLAIHLGTNQLSESQKSRRWELLKSWEQVFTPPHDALWCGVCQQFQPSWEHRQCHVLQHAKDGCTSLDWMPHFESIFN